MMWLRSQVVRSKPSYIDLIAELREPFHACFLLKLLFDRVGVGGDFIRDRECLDTAVQVFLMRGIFRYNVKPLRTSFPLDWDEV